MTSSFFADETPGFGIRWRGYDRIQVDEYLRQFTERHDAQDEPLTSPPAFDRVLRGYDEDEVDRFIRQLSASSTPPHATAPQRPPAPGGRTTGPNSWEYRAPGSALVAIAVSMGILVLGGAFAAGMSDDNPAALRVLLPVLMVGGLALLLWSARRSGTYVSRYGIVTYGVFRRTETHWKEIQGVRRRPLAGAETAVVYTRQGKELRLHQLNSRYFEVEREVRALRGIWEKRRGPGWKPIPEVVSRMSDRTLS